MCPCTTAISFLGLDTLCSQTAAMTGSSCPCEPSGVAIKSSSWQTTAALQRFGWQKFAGESPYAPKNIRQKSLKQRWLSSHKAKLCSGKYVLVSKKTFILYKPEMSLNEIPIDVCKINYTFRHLQMGCERLTLCHRMPTIFPFFTVWPWPLSSLDALDTHAAYAEKLRALMA